MEAYRTINALGTEVEFCLQSENSRSLESDLVELEKIVTDFEKKFSRFLLSSELCLFNETAECFLASSIFVDILLKSRHFYYLTQGIFDPSILVDLEKIGYDQSFDLINQLADKKRKTSLYKTCSFDSVSINAVSNIIAKPIKARLDFGGIGKGYVVDLLSNKLKEKGYQNFWISAGGDMYLSGVTENKQKYQVGVQNPLNPDVDITKVLVFGNELAVATSGITKREWQLGGVSFNHIIDPRTRTSVSNDLLSVTVVSNTTIKSDVFAKTILILGKAKGLEFINSQVGSEALIIDKNLEFSLSTNMGQYLTNI